MGVVKAKGVCRSCRKRFECYIAATGMALKSCFERDYKDLMEVFKEVSAHEKEIFRSH